MQIFRKTPNFDFLGKRRIAYVISGVAIAVSLLTPLVKKPNWGVDFAGGTEIRVQFSKPTDAGDVRKSLEAAGIDANVQRFGEEGANEYLVRVGHSSLFTDAEFAAQVEPKLREQLPVLLAGREGVEYSEKEGDQVQLTAPEGQLSTEKVRAAFEAAGYRIQDVRAITDGRKYSVIFRGIADKVEQQLQSKLADASPVVRSVDQVGAAVGAELKWSAIKSMVLAVLLILLYIGLRFDFRFAPGGVVALAHDAIIVIGYYTVSGAEINTNTIAAVLTIIGFSINDTIVIFDRVREDMQKYKGRELERTINQALNETLSRTLLTAFTVVLSLGGLIVFTVGSLREFSMAMLVGLISGTYSTIYIASPLVLLQESLIARAKGKPSAKAAAV